MNFECAKRIVALQRQIAAYKAMERRTALTPQECEALVTPLSLEIEAIRHQSSLGLETAVLIAPSAGATPPQGGKKGA